MYISYVSGVPLFLDHVDRGWEVFELNYGNIFLSLRGTVHSGKPFKT